MNNKRQEYILEILEKKGEIQLNELKEIFPDVSMMTLRRDLIKFEKKGNVFRTYGGAVSVKKKPNGIGEENPYSFRVSENVEAKIQISKKALEFVEKGRSIYFDAGSTIMYLAERLLDDNYSIVTSGINISLELIKKTKLSVIFLGGLVNRNTLSVSGSNTISFLENINIDLAFMSASAFSIESGFTISNNYECELKRKVIQNAKKIIMLMDSSKNNKNLPFTFAKLEDIDLWISEKELSPEIIKEAKKNEVQLL
jgi:DeoR/GlpR family transcriptional regulator of sugar metabolism